MSDWHIFLWARLHSAEFRYCYIKLPLAIKLRWSKNYHGWTGSISLDFQPVGVYVPWSVRAAFYAAHQDVPSAQTMFDDIPF